MKFAQLSTYEECLLSDEELAAEDAIAEADEFDAVMRGEA